LEPIPPKGEKKGRGKFFPLWETGVKIKIVLKGKESKIGRVPPFFPSGED
jgi:hypothetical protein